MSLLFIYPDHMNKGVGGREQLSLLHRGALSVLLGDEFHEFALSQSGTSPWPALTGQVDGATKRNLTAILAQIDALGINSVWLDGTNLGWLARAIKRERLAITIISFAHNVEAAFFASALRRRPGVRPMAVLLANWIAERMAAQSSDRLIALNSRDGEQFERLYGRTADALLPMALAAPAIEPHAPVQLPPQYLLFVGGGFYANRDGIIWYAENVAPRLSIKTLVVGHGMEDIRDQLETQPSMALIGKVDSLRPYYQGAEAVVAPIFAGSGMKTKVAEAWMFGKRVIGTSEAFVGYEPVEGCLVCRDADDFVKAIDTTIAEPGEPFVDRLKTAFARSHSFDALRQGVAKILADTP